MNKLKVRLGGVISGVATVTFVVTKAIVWPQAIVMADGSGLGGYSTGHYSQKLPQFWVKELCHSCGHCDDDGLLLARLPTNPGMQRPAQLARTT